MRAAAALLSARAQHRVRARYAECSRSIDQESYVWIFATAAWNGARGQLPSKQIRRHKRGQRRGRE